MSDMPVTSAEYKQRALRQLDFADRASSDTSASQLMRAQVNMLAALLTRLEEDDAKYEAEHEQWQAEFAKKDAEMRQLSAPLRPPARVRVFHNTDPVAMADGLGPEDRVVEVFAYYDAAVTGLTADREIAQRCFDLFNPGSPIAEADHRSGEYFARGNRSFSVGDVVSIDGRHYACAGRDWRLIDELPEQEFQRRPGSTPFYTPAEAR